MLHSHGNMLPEWFSNMRAYPGEHRPRAGQYQTGDILCPTFRDGFFHTYFKAQRKCGGWNFQIETCLGFIPRSSRIELSVIILVCCVNVDIQFDQILTLDPNIRRWGGEEPKLTQCTIVSPISGLLWIVPSSWFTIFFDEDLDQAHF